MAASGSGTTFQTVNGVAMTYGFDYDIVLTGTEATTLKPYVWTIVYGDGNDAPLGTWGTRYAQVASEYAAEASFTNPLSLNFIHQGAGSNPKIFPSFMIYPRK